MSTLTSRKATRFVLGSLVCAVMAAAVYAQTSGEMQSADTRQWIRAGQGGMLEADAAFNNLHGKLGIVNAGGAVDMTGHPFFEPIGSNGRACVTCHQPSDSMGLALASIRQQWELTQGDDPLFDPIDGANCPNLPRADPSSHSLLLNRGLIRVGLAWPPGPRNGVPVVPEFDIEVVRDPTGCNTSTEYGLESAKPTISVYRRPRIAANAKYVSYESNPLNAKRLAMVVDRDRFTGKYMSMNIMSDAREASLRTQAVSAARDHLQMQEALPEDMMEKIVSFEEQVFAAQVESNVGGALAYAGGPDALGPRNMEKFDRGLGDNFGVPLFRNFDMWKTAAPGETAAQREFRESVARGHDVFFIRVFYVTDTAHINTVGLGNPMKRTCATCHNSAMVGTDLSAGWVDVGTANLPYARQNVPNPFQAEVQHDLPLFKITCNDEARPHPFLGRVIYTQDPGRALISGKCYDVGAIVMGQFRGLAARAPYFSNGSASTLRDLVDFYDRRFNIGYTEQEKADLTNFLSVL
ncbi:MAG: hypothetical protein RLZZ227_471 [Pseudomonadota bacterium]|jgi:hypothetical protein